MCKIKIYLHVSLTCDKHFWIAFRLLSDITKVLQTFLSPKITPLEHYQTLPKLSFVQPGGYLSLRMFDVAKYLSQQWPAQINRQRRTVVSIVNKLVLFFYSSLWKDIWLPGTLRTFPIIWNTTWNFIFQFTLHQK